MMDEAEEEFELSDVTKRIEGVEKEYKGGTSIQIQPGAVRLLFSAFLTHSETFVLQVN